MNHSRSDETTELRALRRERGLTVEHLAFLAGVSKSTISKAERGLHQLRPETVVILSRALKVSPQRLAASAGDQ